MVADDPCRVGRSHVDDIGRLAVGEVLFRPSQRGFQQAIIPQTHRAAMQRKQPTMQRDRITLVDPDRFCHLRERAAYCDSGQ